MCRSWLPASANAARLLRTLLAGDDLFTDLAEAAFVDILEGNATSAQIAGFAVGLRAKGETIEELPSQHLFVFTTRAR